jgi:hypothetical protein
MMSLREIADRLAGAHSTFRHYVVDAAGEGRGSLDSRVQLVGPVASRGKWKGGTMTPRSGRHSINQGGIP